MNRILAVSFLTIFSFIVWSFSWSNSTELAHTDGQKIKLNSYDFVINAIILDYNALNRFDTPTLPLESTYQEIKNLGFNTVKLRLNYKDFEISSRTKEYKKAGFSWLDKHIEFAKKNDLKLIFSLYVAPGGHQSFNHNQEFWLNAAFQKRFKNLWMTITQRYKSEPTILAFDLLDNPSPKYSIGQWKQLATNLITSIRQYGNHHIIIIQNCSFPEGSTTNQLKSEHNFVYLKDLKNIIYDFHFYGSKEFTWQRVKGLGYDNVNEIYPDKSKYTFPDDLEIFKVDTDNNRIGIGTNELGYIDGRKYLINDSSITSILPVIYSNKLMPGYVCYNNITIQEFSPTGQFIRDVMIVNPCKIEGWEMDHTNDPFAKFSLEADYGTLAFPVIRIDKVETPTRVFNKNLRFVPKQGYYYSIGAHTLTQSTNFEGESYLRFEYEKSASGKLAGARTKEGIKIQLQYFLDWGDKKNVPLLMGEYGTSDYSFKRNRGGDRYLKDLTEIISIKKMNSCFNSFDDQYFGIYDIDDKGKIKSKKAQLAVWTN